MEQIFDQDFWEVEGGAVINKQHPRCPIALGGTAQHVLPWKLHPLWTCLLDKHTGWDQRRMVDKF